MSALVALLIGGTSIGAQPPAAAPDAPAAPVGPGQGGEGRVAGRVVRVTATGERGVPRQWVVLHGIGASGGRAIDSVQTSVDGDYRLRYARASDSTMQYFVST